MNDVEFPTLETPRLLLNQLVPDDRQAVFDIFSDPNVVEYYDVELFKEISEADNLINYFKARFVNQSGIRWAVRRVKDQRLIGTVGFTTWNNYDHSVTIGYDLAKSYWRSGYATEMVEAVLKYAFSVDFPFFVNRVEASILPLNTASIKLVKSFGFIYEGTLRDKCYWNEAFHSMELYSLIRRDLASNPSCSH